jgi:hypothetical protein
MRNLFKQKLILKLGVLLLLIGVFALPFIQSLFPENRSWYNTTGAFPNNRSPQLGLEPEPSGQDTMTYARFKELEDKRQFIKSRQEFSNTASGSGFEIVAFGIRSLSACDTCLVAGNLSRAPSLYYLVLSGYYLDPQTACYSWNGKNYMSRGEQKEFQEVPFRYSFSDYAERLSNKKGAVLIPIAKKTFDILYPVFVVFFVGSGLFLFFIYFSLPLSILIRISNGQVFTDRNIRQLRWLAWALVAPTFIILALKYALATLFHKELPAEVHPSFLSAFEYSTLPFIAALVVFAVLIAFKEGQNLQKEQDLTI